MLRHPKVTALCRAANAAEVDHRDDPSVPGLFLPNVPAIREGNRADIPRPHGRAGKKPKKRWSR
jgi:hypothetical protein